MENNVLKNALNRTRFDIVSWIRLRPAFFLPLMSLNKGIRKIGGDHLVNRNTELVIEGFFRCGNTFAALAFVYSQPRKVILATHTHAPATVVQAVRWGIPTLVLIRRPFDTLLSLMLKKPEVTTRQHIREYIRYYKNVMPCHKGFVFATFEEVTTNFGLVIDRVNHRFDTNFTLFEHNEENVKRVFSRIEGDDMRVEKGNILKFSIPKVEKETAKMKLRDHLQTQEFEAQIIAAEEIYQAFINQEVTSRAG